MFIPLSFHQAIQDLNRREFVATLLIAGEWVEGVYPTERVLLLYYNSHLQCHLLIICLQPCGSAVSLYGSTASTEPHLTPPSISNDAVYNIDTCIPTHSISVQSRFNPSWLHACSNPVGWSF